LNNIIVFTVFLLYQCSLVETLKKQKMVGQANMYNQSVNHLI